jgi:hypothetical protein
MDTRRRNSRSSNSESAQLEDTSPRDVLAAEADADSHNERIARRAYQRYENRGRDDGRDQEDWFEAERELLSDTPAE